MVGTERKKEREREGEGKETGTGIPGERMRMGHRER